MTYNKAILFDDEEIAEMILLVTNPRDIKSLGCKVKYFDVSVWNECRFDILVRGLRVKFANNGLLWKKLDSIGDAVLVECSSYDKICGIGLEKDDPDVFYSEKWRGQNLLGKALMQVRNELREEG